MDLKQKVEKSKKADFKIFLVFVFLRHNIRQIPLSISLRMELNFKYVLGLIDRNFDMREVTLTLIICFVKGNWNMTYVSTLRCSRKPTRFS